MKGLKTFLIAILFFVWGAGSGVYFTSNVRANKKEKDGYRLVLKLKEIEFDDSGLEGVDDFNVSIFDTENEVIRKVWPAYKDTLTAILEEGLKKQNLRIVSEAFDESGKPIIPDFLKLKIDAVRDEASGFIVGSVNLYLNGVFVNHETKKFVNADRWHKSQAFMAGETEASKSLEGITRGLMDEFMKDYSASQREVK